MGLQVGNTVTRTGHKGETLSGRVNDLTETHAYVLWDGWALPRWEPLSELTIDPWLAEAAETIRNHKANHSDK